MKRFFLMLIALFFLSLPSKASAQQLWVYDSRAGVIPVSGYGYDPYYRQPYGGYYDPKMIDPCYGSDQFYQGMRGSMHVHKGEVHFRPCDPTDSRINTAVGGALGAGGGALVGASVAGQRGAAIGATAGAIVGGVLASRRSHDNCLVVRSATAVETRSGHVTTEAVSATAPVNVPELQTIPEVTSQRPIAGPAVSGSAEELEICNQTRVYVELYDGDTYLGRMSPGSVLRVGFPKNRYRGFALVPNPDGGFRKDELDREVSPTSWIFVEPDVARGR